MAAAGFLATAAVAALISLPDGLLSLLAVLAVLTALGAFVVTAWRLGRAPSDRQMARFVEERAAQQPEVAPLDDVLVSAVAVDPGSSESPRDFRELVVAAAVRRLESLDPAAIVPAGQLRRAFGVACAGLLSLAIAITLAAPMLGRAAETAWIAIFPSLIDVQVVPGDVRVPLGQPVTIRASVRAGLKALTRFTPRLTVEAGPPERRDSRTVQMAPDGAGFLFTFDSVDRSFHYRVTAGSKTSKAFSVTALVGARVARIELRYEYPAFANLAPRDEANGGDIYAPAGTKVRVRVHTDKPIVSGNMLFAQSRDGVEATGSVLRPIGDQVLEGELTLARDDSYRVRLTDRDGLNSSGDTEYFLRVMDDRPPDVRILRPASDQQITPLEEVAIEARAEDDYGLTRFDFVYAVAGRPPQVVPFERVAGTDVARAGTLTLAVEDLRVQPGDVITYYARARDVGRGKKPTETRSDIFFLEIRPFSEEFVLAQSQAMSGMASEQIETLITAQKEIINATWNIERRASSGAGRSASDITAIAAAQSELRTRAEQIAPPAGRGRGAMRFPQQVVLPQGPRGGRPAADPVGAAISAMSRAIGQLEVQKTSDALTHEMAALQGLVQAQAEVRRREVAQQAGASMGGMGRQGQDLSALFDKELQRQQRTNYETRSQAETRPDRPETESALDKIRDLAQRQEELARQQRELANRTQSAEESKRQLEKLMREQEALRQQAEELARQVGQQPGAPQRGNAPQQDRGGSGEIRDAADEMRGAAGELQRQSPGAAAQRGERAAAGLRKLEEQMRRDSPEAQRQAAGDARLEAQQIADEQRRIAEQASRLEKETSGDGSNQDAWRRLAGEKDKLADRVDALEKSVQQMAAGQKPGAQPGQAGNLGKELAQGQISGRMRDTAKKMREVPAPAAGGRGTKPSPQRGAAEAEQQLARTLDQMVDRMSGGDAQTLARELDQSRSIRERLNRLENQVREAGGSEESQQLREQYAKELGAARDSLSRLERGSPGSGLGGTSPEEHEWSGVDKGTEAFKQDFSKWESLRKDVDSALDRYEASIISRAARKGVDDRLSAGGSDRAPDDYRRLIARYYESLAKKK